MDRKRVETEEKNRSKREVKYLRINPSLSFTVEQVGE